MRDFRTLRPRDERRYVIAATTLLEADSANLRERLRSLRSELRVPLHHSTLTQSKRPYAIEAVSEFTDWEGFLFETRDPNEQTERHVRDKLLRVALPHSVRKQGASTVRIESRDVTFARQFDDSHYGLDQHDISTIVRLRSKKCSLMNFRCNVRQNGRDPLAGRFAV